MIMMIIMMIMMGMIIMMMKVTMMKIRIPYPQKEYPDLSKADAQTYILELRGQNPTGKLSGMSIQDIIKKVGTFIERDRSNRVAAAQGRENT